jgi:GcrA cell cycle regulator
MGFRTDIWTTEQDATLKRMAQEGYSASKIANVVKKTRNAVIGRSSRVPGARLGNAKRANERWPSHRVARDRPNPLITGSKGAAGRAERHRERLRLTADDVLHPTPVVPYQPEAKTPVGGPVGFLGLERHHCRWPLWGDAERPLTNEQFYCGKEAVIALPYCSFHANVSYRPSIHK